MVSYFFNQKKKKIYINFLTKVAARVTSIFFLEFQLMIFTSDDNSLLLNQDTNQFLEHELVS